ncbi:LOG family protein [Micromonospora sp. KC721]|uniref:SLOG cluster 4 domain-containing protein n=1 Tax=Micromonospora sp. KC721 TaxID=2530380 RepID=UPI00104908A4|nr:LOG family protein [Micromonospora sp. KC721]TDB79164.1 dethiobiotin synthetase [Micromonospora sp. KC721]
MVQVAVCGPASASPTQVAQARRVGELLATRGATVLCGGGGGVMAAVAAGARAHGGLVIAVRPDDGTGAGPYAQASATLLTNLGQARNAVLVCSADAVIAVGGSWGTLSEVALAMRRGDVPVVVLGGWRVVDDSGVPVAGPCHVDTPEEAVRLALTADGGS